MNLVEILTSSGAWAALAGVASAVAAIFSFTTSVSAKRLQSDTSEVTNAITISQNISESVRRVYKAQPSEKQFEFTEMFNTFEVYAALINNKKVKGVPKKIIEDFLSDTMRVIASDADYRRIIGNSILNTKDYEQLFLLCGRQIPPIEINFASIIKEMREK